MMNIKLISNLIPFTEYFKIVLFHLFFFIVLVKYVPLMLLLLGFIWSTIVWISFDISFHRMWSHKSLSCPKYMEWIFSFINVFTGMKSAIDFCGPHIWHHKYSDTKKDTNWPEGMPIWKIIVQHKSVYYNVNKTEMLKMCKHLLKNDTVKFFHRYFYFIFLALHIVLVFINPILIIPIISIPVLFAYMIIIPGGALLQHTWGEKIYTDKSSNNKLLSFISLGFLCQHSNHHKHPYSYTFDTDGDAFDLIGVIIKKMNDYKLVTIK